MAQDSPVIALAKDLLARPSITPEDEGCQELMIARLEALGFNIERMVFEDTTNFWARRGTQNRYLLLPDIPMWFQQAMKPIGIPRLLHQQKKRVISTRVARQI